LSLITPHNHCVAVAYLKHLRSVHQALTAAFPDALLDARQSLTHDIATLEGTMRGAYGTR
jgi:hypothetical protein